MGNRETALENLKKAQGKQTGPKGANRLALPDASVSLRQADLHVRRIKKELERAKIDGNPALVARLLATLTAANEQAARIRGEAKGAQLVAGHDIGEAEAIIHAHDAQRKVPEGEVAQRCRDFLVRWNRRYPQRQITVGRFASPKRLEQLNAEHNPDAT